MGGRTLGVSLSSELDNKGNPDFAWPGDVRTGEGAMANLTIDCVVLGLNHGRLKVLTVEYGVGPHKGCWALPGGWVHIEEGIDDAAARHLRDLTGLNNIYLQQLQAFGDVSRSPGRRIVTVAYYALVRQEDYAIVVGNTTSDVQWRDLDEPRNLIFDHENILQLALKSLRHKVRHEPIGFNLLPQKFTLLQLQELYEAILGLKLDKPNFRRKMMKMKLLTPCGEKQKHVAHRAAELYRFDEEVYQDLCARGFSFEV